MNLIDAHVHFDRASFLIPENLTVFLNSVEEDDWIFLQDKASSIPAIVPFFGIHPWYIDTISNQSWLLKLEQIIGSHGWFHVGEIGLDRIKAKKDIVKYNIDRQIAVFTHQLELAVEYNRFVSIHCVKAWDLLVPILSRFKGQLKGIIHYFSGSVQIMHTMLDLGLYISFMSNVYHSNSNKISKSFEYCPLDRLLLESDINVGDNKTVIVDHYHNAAGHRKLKFQELVRIIDTNGKIFTDRTTDR